MISVRLHHRTWAAVALAALAARGAAARGDDVVVEQPPPARPGRPVQGFATATVDLGQVFDAQAFADPVAVDQIGMAVTWNEPGAGDAKPPEDEIAHRLEPVWRRAEAKIATVDRIVGLSAQQRTKLTVAAQSDRRRLTAAVVEARAKYAGRTLPLEPLHGGLDVAGRTELAQAQEDGQRCRQLLQAAAGPESLLAKVVVSTLDEEQAKRYAAVIQGRAARRWQAVVAAGLAQLDDQVGFTQKQHDAVAAFLLADAPRAEDESQARAAVPAGMQVAQRLAAWGEEHLAAILDPRQRQVVSLYAQQGQLMGEGPMVLDGGGMF